VKVSRGQDTRAEFNRTLVRRTLARADVPFTRAINDRYFSPQAGQREPIAEPDDDGRTKGFAKGKRFKIKTAVRRQRAEGGPHAALTEATGSRGRARDARADRRHDHRERSAATSPAATPTPPASSRSSSAPPRIAPVADTSSTRAPATCTAASPAAHDHPGPLNPRDVTECHPLLPAARLRRLLQRRDQVRRREPRRRDLRDRAGHAGQRRRREPPTGRPTTARGSSRPRPSSTRGAAPAQLHTIREAYEFRAGGRHNGTLSNYWDDSGDSADEVQWRRFATATANGSSPTSGCSARKPTIYIDGEDGPAGLARRASSASTPAASTSASRPPTSSSSASSRGGAARPAPSSLENLGALDGDWLIANNDRTSSRPVEESTLTLQRPQPKKKEPAPKTNTSS
jgi:hypothetical protein